MTASMMRWRGRVTKSQTKCPLRARTASAANSIRKRNNHKRLKATAGVTLRYLRQDTGMPTFVKCGIGMTKHNLAGRGAKCSFGGRALSNRRVKPPDHPGYNEGNGGNADD